MGEREQMGVKFIPPALLAWGQNKIYCHIDNMILALSSIFKHT
jgi:hypothetical protein